eukprot:TRINITY_DN13352_c0_g1_i1.p2 TRINITY_DN13352_c0_g1~~TRINITY_DN13352_c0_g1_i1.p2  ORF type:complete len:324 (+),score=155.19 TRINITY_DN13352_c0_g1_i1:270-1241(+)
MQQVNNNAILLAQAQAQLQLQALQLQALQQQAQQQLVQQLAAQQVAAQAMGVNFPTNDVLAQMAAMGALPAAVGMIPNGADQQRAMNPNMTQIQGAPALSTMSTLSDASLRGSSTEGSASSQNTTPRRAEGDNLIVNSLASWMDQDWLENTFARFGVLDHARVVCNIATNKSKGFGFVKFQKASDAAKAVEALNGFLPPRAVKPIKVSVAREQEAPSEKQSVNVYISGVKDVFTSSDMNRLCGRYGRVVEVKVLSLRNHSDGVCFVKYETVEQAAACCQALNKSTQTGRDGRTVSLVARFADKLGKSRQNFSDNECPKLLQSS